MSSETWKRAPIYTLMVLGCLMALGTKPTLAAEKILYAFKGGSDGKYPFYAPLIGDSEGNLFGTTNLGGDSGCQCGTVFELSQGGTETVLHAFQGDSDGAFPLSGVIADISMNLYGTTENGGGSANCTSGCGAVYQITPGASEKILYAFQGGSDGLNPRGSLVLDDTGNLYGTTVQGGSYSGSECAGTGCGTVFELNPDGTKTSLYAFQGGSDGAAPLSGVIRDISGNLYGTTEIGGINCNGEGNGCGTVFEIATDGTESLLHSFQGGSDGAGADAGLIFDSAGNLYGTTISGGGSGCGGPGCGTVYKVTPGGAESVLYAFKGGNDGEYPEVGLVMDKSGNLYGTTYFGGGTSCRKTRRMGCGTVFKLTPNGTQTVLVAFRLKYGQYPASSLLLNKKDLYGTTSQGTVHGDGLVFKVRK